MSNADTVTADYIAIWNETDPAARRALIEKTYSPEGTYTDPLVEVAGWDGLDAAIGAVQGQFAGLVFTLGSEVDAHHDLARFTWNLGPAGEEPMVVGFDVVVLDADGRIKAVHGFLDKVPAGL